MDAIQQPSGKVVSGTPQPFAIPAYVLDDLCSRFIINIPQEERLNPIRIFFQIELAHWFYLDFYCIENPELHTCGIKDFSSQIFRHCPFLNQYAEEVDKRLEDWKQYKMSVPTYGAIILDPEIKFCLLVQGYWAKSSWGFPKGKINEEETEQECAVREVFEETGFHINELNAIDYIENQMYDQLTRLYIVAGVSLDTKFQTKTRKEIKCMQWFPVDALPAHKKDQTCRTQLNMNSNNFFTVIPFIKPLRKWIANKKQLNLDLKSQLIGKVDMSGAITPASGNGNLTPVSGRQLTDKQRMKQQQSYNQQIYSDFHEYQKIRDCKSSTALPGVSTGNGFKGNGNKMLNNGCNNSTEAGNPLIMTDSNGAHKFHKNKHQHSASPKQNYKKILSRDKMKDSDSGLLGFCIQDLELSKATAWSNFRLNLEAIWTGLP